MILATHASFASQLDDAQYLASEGFLVERVHAYEYEIDRIIFRQEMVGVALKMKWLILPVNYRCQWYFVDISDSTPNNWICRVVELASDIEFISRNNRYFRPEDPVTKLEAAAVIMKSVDMKPDASIAGITFDEDVSPWQKPYIATLFEKEILTQTTWVGANDTITRGELFEIARKVYDYQKLTKSYQTFLEHRASDEQILDIPFQRESSPYHIQVPTSAREPIYKKYLKLLELDGQ